MLQQDKPDDFVIATGHQYSVRDFVNAVAKDLDMSISWKGNGIVEVGYDNNGNKIIKISTRYFRPTEVETLLGDASKAKEKLDWAPKISFNDLVTEMSSYDLKLALDEKI